MLDQTEVRPPLLGLPPASHTQTLLTPTSPTAISPSAFWSLRTLRLDLKFPRLKFPNPLRSLKVMTSLEASESFRTSSGILPVIHEEGIKAVPSAQLVSESSFQYDLIPTIVSD